MKPKKKRKKVKHEARKPKPVRKKRACRKAQLKASKQTRKRKKVKHEARKPKPVRKKSLSKGSTKSKQANKNVAKRSIRSGTIRVRRKGIQGKTGEKGKQKKVTIATLERQKKVLVKEERRLRHKLEKARKRLKDRERDISIRKMASGLRAERLAKAKEWLEVVSKKAQEGGHRIRVVSANNRDGTADMQATIYDWKEPYREKLFELFANLNDLLPNLGAGIKVRVQTRVSADRIEKDSKAKKRYAYLPTVLGHKAVYYNYVDPRSLGQLFFKVEFGITKVTEDGWRPVAIAIDVRFDPRWIKE